MTWGVIVVAAILAANVADAQQRPAWHCHPAGGSCVASEPGAASPYPRSRLRRTWVIFMPKGAGYSAFTTEAACLEARRAMQPGPSRCHKVTAAQALSGRFAERS